MPISRPSVKKSTRKSTNQKPHLIIEAGPGSGKTTTMLAGLNLMSGLKPSWYDEATDEQKAIWEEMDGSYKSIAFQAFNKSIATEIQEKVPPHVKASTFHSFGYKVLRDAGFKLRMSGANDSIMVKVRMGFDPKERMDEKSYRKCQKIVKFIGLLKNNLLNATKANILELAAHNSIEVNGDLEEIRSICDHCMQTMIDNVKNGSQQWISFDDMLWLPIVLELDFSSSKVDLLICDESQDLNAVQHRMVTQSGSRLICVGDPRQAIYGFRGADSKSLETLETILSKTDRGVKKMPLLTSFRLPVSGVENVLPYAPALKARKDAPEGSINRMNESEANADFFQGGELVLSRVNANIFSMAFRLLREKVAVRIEGRDFGKTLINIVSKNSNGETIAEVVDGLNKYNEDEMDRLGKKQFSEKLIDAHNEKMNCLYSMISECNSLTEIVSTIETLFNNDTPRSQVVLLSTIHRAKGLEADRVLILDPSQIPHPMAKLEHERQQEFNLKFVAETRHLTSLYYVDPKNTDDDDRDELCDPVREDLMDIDA